MSAHPSTLAPVACSSDAVAGPDLESLVRRFEPGSRRAVRRLLRSSPRFVDLAAVFPGAVHRIAIADGPNDTIAQAMRMVVNGAALKQVTATLGLPMWLRRLPPEAFCDRPGPLPSSDVFSRRIANRLPGAGDDAAFWLQAVCFAAHWGHEEFAIWLAGQPIHSRRGDAASMLGALTAYAWFSRARSTAAQRLIVVPWRPELAFDTALCAAKSWFNRIRLVLQLRTGVVTDPWFSPGTCNGYTFEPLLDADSLLREAQRMQNCADQYADRIARDRCRLFSISSPTGGVATLEIGPHQREIGMLAINQLKARHNMPAPLEIWQAALMWAGSQRGLRRMPDLCPPERPLCARTWGLLMEPYAKAKASPSWLPAAPTAAAYGELEQGLALLACRGGVTSWLFT